MKVRVVVASEMKKTLVARNLLLDGRVSSPAKFGSPENLALVSDLWAFDINFIKPLRKLFKNPGK